MPDTSRRISPSTLYYGDCLDVMGEWADEQVDLIYLDPPFNSSADYNILFGSKSNGKTGQMIAFEDTWSWDGDAEDRVRKLKAKKVSPIWSVMEGLERILGPSGMLAYLSYMGERLEPCKRLLKPSGSIYLHCDPTASHYLKILMDAIFGKGAFLNEIIWHYENASRGKKQWAKSHDVLMWYRSSTNHPFCFNRDAVLAPFKSGMTAWRYSRGGQAGKPMPKGKTPDDVINMPSLNAMSKERMGYPTQKPLSLLDRIIKASSNEGDLVLDPFCGCGTTVVAAENLKRTWAGIDSSSFAVETARARLVAKRGMDFSVFEEPNPYAAPPPVLPMAAETREPYGGKGSRSS